MKKLMIAAAAALSATVFCQTVQASVASSNVVGYNKASPLYSSFMMSMPFTAVDGGEVKLNTIAGTFAEEDNIQVSWMDEDGYVQFTVYTWWSAETMGEDGWYDEGFEPAGDTLTLPVGSAVWFITSSGNATPDGLTTSGGVKKGFVEHNGFPESSNMIGSAYPIAFCPNAETVIWSGINEEDNIQVAWMDGDGYVQFNVYTWWSEDSMGTAGWYDEGFELVSEPVAEVGQGFWLILSDPANAYMKEISPLAE